MSAAKSDAGEKSKAECIRLHLKRNTYFEISERLLVRLLDSVPTLSVDLRREVRTKYVKPIGKHLSSFHGPTIKVVGVQSATYGRNRVPSSFRVAILRDQLQLL